VPLTFAEMMRISSNPAAADLFLYSPIEKGASLFHGVRKAGMMLVQLPMAIYIAAVAAFATRAHPETMFLLIPGLFVFPAVSLLPALLDSYVPLSIGSRTGQRAVQSLIILVVMVPAALIGMLMAWAQRSGFLWPVVAAEAVIMLGLYAVLLRVVAWRASNPRRRALDDSGKGSWSSPA
jgi:hypothetical protein